MKLGKQNTSVFGSALIILAGIFWGSMGIFVRRLGTVALRRYSPFTVTTWTFIIAGIGSILISHPADIVAKFTAAPSLPGLLGLSLLTALVTAVIPFLAYTLGLRHVEASKAGILATVEPMV